MVCMLLFQYHLKSVTGDRLWWFQVCTEVAYFQVAPANDSIRSSKIDARQEFCQPLLLVYFMY